MPKLHAFDHVKPQNTKVNLSVLWWKAISGNQRFSKTADGGITYDMLPSFTRNIVKFPFSWLYAPLHHQNVALRTTFLDAAVCTELDHLDSTTRPVTVIVLGGGFDTRALRFAASRPMCKSTWIELDLPHVIRTKRNMLRRFCDRRPHFSALMPELVPCDLNNELEVRKALEQVLVPIGAQGGACIFVAEAVLLYLNPDRAEAVFKACFQNHMSTTIGPRSFVFADRLPGVAPARNSTAEEGGGKDKETLGAERRKAEGFFRTVCAPEVQLVNWCPKPGLARHMGTARYAPPS